MAANKSAQEISEIVSRVIQEIGQEVQGYEATFGVQDFQKHLGQLAKTGGQSAWEISYKTGMSRIEQLTRPGGQSAWEISYKTGMSSVEVVKTSKE